jgi:hypothetical protein
MIWRAPLTTEVLPERPESLDSKSVGPGEINSDLEKTSSFSGTPHAARRRVCRFACSRGQRAACPRSARVRHPANQSGKQGSLHKLTPAFQCNFSSEPFDRGLIVQSQGKRKGKRNPRLSAPVGNRLLEPLLSHPERRVFSNQSQAPSQHDR